jgi:hypothetical protein
MGFLTLRPSGKGEALLALPNETIKRIFYSYFGDMLLKSTNEIDITLQKKAMSDISEIGDNTLFVQCMSDFFKEASNRLYIQFSEKHFQIIGYVLAKYFSSYKAELEWGNGGFADLALLPKGSKKISFYAIIELKYIRVKDLIRSEEQYEDNVSHDQVKSIRKKKTPENILAERRKIIQNKWNDALAQIKRYAAETEASQLQAEGKLKKWIIIFCTHRCLVNQEINDPETATMVTNDFEWWF